LKVVGVHATFPELSCRMNRRKAALDKSIQAGALALQQVLRE
jgi:hypothetical protein